MVLMNKHIDKQNRIKLCDEFVQIWPIEFDKNTMIIQ